MYYTFYCNERMLLDNWDYYNESNNMLRRTLAKTGMSITDCSAAYFSMMRNPQNVTYDKSMMEEYFKKRHCEKSCLREINSVKIYGQDVRYVQQAKRIHKLSKLQCEMLFAAIFFCRMNNTNRLELDTKPKLLMFKGCISDILHNGKDMDAPWYSVKEFIREMHQLTEKNVLAVDEFQFRLGYSYVYPGFDVLEDDIYYIFDITLENNRLDISKIYYEIFDAKLCFCSICGKEHRVKRTNRSLYCKDCKRAIRREAARTGMARLREQRKAS